jgi:hypothetical protein
LPELDPALKRFLISNKVGQYADGLIDLECLSIPALTELCEGGNPERRYI